MTDRQIERRVGAGLWLPLRRGVYVLKRDAAELKSHVGELGAALLTHGQRDLAVSHASAARILGLARPIAGWGVPTATAATGPTRLRGDVHLLVASLAEGDVVMAGRIPVTSLARTVADCMRTLPPHDGLAIADSAARQGLSIQELLSVLARQKGWPGVVQAREVAGLIDGRRENALESWSAWSFHRWEVPAPLWQVEIIDQIGFFCGRVDGWWNQGVAGEADGRAKYALAAAERGGADAAGLSDVLERERKREQSVRRTGAELVRWGPKDLFDAIRMENLSSYIVRLLRQRSSQGVPFRGLAKQRPIPPR